MKMKMIEDLSYGEGQDNIFDLYISEKREAPVFVYFHGGGLEGGSYKAERDILLQLVQRGITVISAEYRIYPKAKFPDYINDAADMILWVKNNLNKYAEYSDIFVGGSSAGAYITQMLCFNQKYLNDRGINVDEISGFIHDAGQPTTHFNVLKERGLCQIDGTADQCRVLVDEGAPMYYIDGLQKYPPMVFIVSDNDMPNRYEQTKLMVSILKNYGYDEIELKLMENSEHCSYLSQDNKDIFINHIHQFIEKNKMRKKQC